METNENIKKQMGKFNSTDIEKLKMFQNQLDQLIQKQVMDEDGLKLLDLLCAELEVFKVTYVWRYIKLLKLNHKLD